MHTTLYQSTNLDFGECQPAVTFFYNPLNHDLLHLLSHKKKNLIYNHILPFQFLQKPIPTICQKQM